ncbi:MAG: carbohydrate ABC transporter substrate-binding protein, partial [Clostridia bacterium]|nr:carbohydrate ABC transporter substrate-binding protein [Clostridia bacterium]
MKTRILSLILAIILLLPALAGCDSETVPSQQTGTVAIPGNESEYPDFELPEETDTLVLYSSGLNTKTLTYAVEIFKRMYPEVNVDWHKLEQDEFVTQIRAEIPAGKGPDLLYASGSDFSDIYKTMSTGVFEDLNPYIANDPDFNLDDCIEGIMEEGLYGGARYILPVSHRSQPLLTTEEALAEIGCTVDDIRTFSGFLDTANRYKEKYPENNAIVNYARAGYDASSILMFFQCSGFRFIDYDAGEIVLNEERFREMIDYCKSLHGGKPDQKETKYDEEIKLKNRVCLFLEGPGSPLTIEQTWRKIQVFHETPVMFTVPDISDGQTTMIQTFGAIPKGSPNKLNAWRFLKILLSEEIQSNSHAL